MNFYTSVIPVGDNLLVRGYRNGKRFSDRVHYRPKLFVPSKKETIWHSIEGAPIEAMEFPGMRDARDFLK